jgi:hypothetical protein
VTNIIRGRLPAGILIVSEHYTHKTYPILSLSGYKAPGYSVIKVKKISPKVLTIVREEATL